MRGYIQKRQSPEPLNLFYPVVQWSKVRLVFIFQYIICFQSQSIDFTNSFSQADIPSGEPIFIEISMDFNSDVGQFDIVIRLKKRLYGQAEAACLYCENFPNGLLCVVLRQEIWILSCPYLRL